MSKGNTAVKKLMNKRAEQARRAAFGTFDRWSKADDIGLDGRDVAIVPRRNIDRCDPPAIKAKERPAYSTRIIETHW